MKKEEADKIYLDEMKALQMSVQEEQARILKEYAKRICPYTLNDKLKTPDGIGDMIKGVISAAGNGNIPEVKVVVKLKKNDEEHIYSLDEVTLMKDRISKL